MDSGAGHVGPERRTGPGRDSRNHGDGLQKNAFRTLRAVQAGVRQTADRGLQRHHRAVAASELMYPDHFSADQRKVVLKGEAYFEVTKDVKRPFSVVLGDMEVKVLGTSFNVSAYPGVKRQTTLIEGQVAVNWHRQQVVIRPGQQAVETDEGLRVASVNVMNYVGWKEHRFVYENKLLGEVLEDLERWYDVEVFVMHDEIRNLHLTANLPKYENMDKVLEIIEYAACVKFEVKGRTVVVRRD